MTNTSVFVQGTLTGMLLDRAAQAADRVAPTIIGADLTYSDLVARSNAVARGLRSLGVGRGDVVALLAENSADHVFVQFATARLGAIEVMLNTAYKGEFLAHQLEVSGASVVIVDEHLAGSVVDITKRLPSLRHIVVRGAMDDVARNCRGIGVLEIGELHANRTEALTDVVDPRPEDPSTITFTSGTTGPSKGAVLSQNYLCTFAEVESSIWCHDRSETFYSCGPLFHLAAKGIAVLGAIYRGVRCVQDERFSVSNFWERIHAEGCTSTLMLGSMVMLLWTRQPSAEEGVGTVVSVPAPPRSLQQAMERRWGCTMESVYGLSEAAPLTCSRPGTPLRPGSSGKVVTDCFDVRVVDDDDAEVPIGGVGEVVVRPQRPNVMFEGYYHDPAATLRKFRNLWFHTGDLGQFDEDGYFYFVDRKEDYLRRRGENISSYEVEEAIARHPAVVEAAVVGVDSELTEQEVKSVVVLRAGSELTHRALIAHCVDNMPYFAVPRYVEFVPDLPRTPSGKVEKHKLRAQGVAGCWDREAAGIVLSGKRDRAGGTKL